MSNIFKNPVHSVISIGGHPSFFKNVETYEREWAERPCETALLRPCGPDGTSSQMTELSGTRHAAHECGRGATTALKMVDVSMSDLSIPMSNLQGHVFRNEEPESSIPTSEAARGRPVWFVSSSDMSVAENDNKGLDVARLGEIGAQWSRSVRDDPLVIVLPDTYTAIGRGCTRRIGKTDETAISTIHSLIERSRGFPISTIASEGNRSNILVTPKSTFDAALQTIERSRDGKFDPHALFDEIRKTQIASTDSGVSDLISNIEKCSVM